MTIKRNDISVNQRLLEVRTVTIENGYVYVRYPRSECSKNRAWLHLTSRPPYEVGKHKLKTNNPWEKNHGGGFWGWSARVGGSVSLEDICQGGNQKGEPLDTDQNTDI